jgi:hypothetical protein
LPFLIPADLPNLLVSTAMSGYFLTSQMIIKFSLFNYLNYFKIICLY